MAKADFYLITPQAPRLWYFYSPQNNLFKRHLQTIALAFLWRGCFCVLSRLAHITADFRQPLGRRNATGKPQSMSNQGTLDVPTPRLIQTLGQGTVCGSLGSSL